MRILTPTRRVFEILKQALGPLFAIVLIALGNSVVKAQLATPSPPKKVAAPAIDSRNAPQNAPTNSAVAPVSSVARAVALPESLTPIHGYQGVLAETLEGTIIASQSIDERFNPASAVKLATALGALRNFGPNHRFLTSAWAAGTIDQATGTLNGDLVISGRDPSFRYEHAVMFARQLNELGIKTVTGNLIVAPGFTMNFDWSAHHSGEEFVNTMDSATRSGAATRAWLEERQLIGDKQSLSSVPSVFDSSAKSSSVARAAAGTPLLTRKIQQARRYSQSAACATRTISWRNGSARRWADLKRCAP